MCLSLSLYLSLSLFLDVWVSVRVRVWLYGGVAMWEFKFIPLLLFCVRYPMEYPGAYHR